MTVTVTALFYFIIFFFSHFDIAKEFVEPSLAAAAVSTNSRSRETTLTEEQTDHSTVLDSSEKKGIIQAFIKQVSKLVVDR